MPTQPVIVFDRFTPDRLGMKCAIEEQSAVPLWDYIRAKDGTYWFWPAVGEAKGDLVHCGDHVMAGKKSDGYGGRVVEFPTKVGPIPIQGPWASNSLSLFKATGVDLRDKHLTWGLVALKREYPEGQYSADYVDVLYLDPPQGAVGTFDRIKTHAEVLADDLDRVVYYYRRSEGGSSEGPICPSDWDEQKRHDYFYPVKEEAK